MTIEVIGHLPCPKCSSTQALKTDGRKHTLKCGECGLLAYYQTQAAKEHIEQRLESGKPPASNNTVTLALPSSGDQLQRYILSVERIDGSALELGPMENEEVTTPPESKKSGGWLEDLF